MQQSDKGTSDERCDELNEPEASAIAAAVARANNALELAQKGVEVVSADDFLAGMQRRAQAAAQHRIREAARGRRGQGGERPADGNR